MLANRHLIFILFLLFCTLSCSTKQVTVSPPTTWQVIKNAEQNGFSRRRYATSSFTLTTYQRVSAASTVCHVYIEGDGNSWKSKHRLSNNPTPKQPLALQLALQDQHPQVIYIARPCQFTPHQLDLSCVPQYWSSHRYAPEVIAAFQATLDAIKKDTHFSLPMAQTFLLIGFSGGASIATLVASERSDVVGLVTVAGDLNHVALNHFHHTTPLTGSLNPMDVVHKLRNLPQQHWSGTKDLIVPNWMANQFSEKINNPVSCQVHTLEGAGHHTGWVENWSKIIQSATNQQG